MFAIAKIVFLRRSNELWRQHRVGGGIKELNFNEISNIEN